MSKKLNIPFEAMGVIPLDPNEIPSIPKNPLLRNVSYGKSNNDKMTMKSATVVFFL